jgi:hypothetical protein
MGPDRREKEMTDEGGMKARAFIIGNTVSVGKIDFTKPYPGHLPVAHYQSPRLTLMSPSAYDGDDGGYAPAESVMIWGWESIIELHDQLAALLAEARIKGAYPPPPPPEEPPF